jgi:hypothetical protein
MKSLLRSLSFAAISAALTVASVAEAGVVFGNLGASGTGSLGGTNTDYGPSDAGELALAQGFSVGAASTALNVQSVTIGLFSTTSGSNPLTVVIYGDSGGSPSSPLFTSSVVNVGNTGIYTFPFVNATLSASTSYWIVPQDAASWYLNADDTSPTEQNASGYSYTGTKRNRPSVGWTTPSPNLNSYSVSIVAVPEPPAIVLSGIGLASAMYAFRRRRG